MNLKCSVCGKVEFTILKEGLCIKCVALQKEKAYLEKNKRRPRISARTLIKSYVIKNMPLTELSDKLDLSKPGLLYWFKYYEIPLKTISQGGKKRIKSNFFSVLNSDSAFLLGYIFTDGDLQYNKKNGKYFLRLYSKYKENLEMVLKLIGSSAKIQERRAIMTEKIRQGKLYFIHIADDSFINELISLGMVRNKNDKIQFPEIDKDLYSHFIRGCWAGSGYVYTNNYGRVISGIVLASKDLIERIEKILNSHGLSKRKIFEHKHTKTHSFYFRYSQGETEKLYHFLYKDASIRNTVAHQTKVFREHFE